jgi:hypothetical protein
MVDERGQTARGGARRRGRVIALDALAAKRGARHHGIPPFWRAKPDGCPHCPSAGWIGGAPGELEPFLSRLHCLPRWKPQRSPVLFERALASGRLHSAYLISGPREAARGRGSRVRSRERLRARRGVRGGAPGAGARARARRSRSTAPATAARCSGTSETTPTCSGSSAAAEDTRVRIGQIRALQHTLRLSGGEGRAARRRDRGRRVG